MVFFLLSFHKEHLFQGLEIFVKSSEHEFIFVHNYFNDILIEKQFISWDKKNKKIIKFENYSEKLMVCSFNVKSKQTKEIKQKPMCLFSKIKLKRMNFG